MSTAPHPRLPRVRTRGHRVEVRNAHAWITVGYVDAIDADAARAAIAATIEEAIHDDQLDQCRAASTAQAEARRLANATAVDSDPTPAHGIARPVVLWEITWRCRTPAGELVDRSQVVQADEPTTDGAAGSADCVPAALAAWAEMIARTMPQPDSIQYARIQPARITDAGGHDLERGIVYPDVPPASFTIHDTADPISFRTLAGGDW